MDTRTATTLAAVLFMVAGLGFITAAVIGGQVVFHALGAVFIAVGAVFFAKARATP
jgi:VIT1/CCC1 family predicted Fe2+/Mn2+ transporter